MTALGVLGCSALRGTTPGTLGMAPSVPLTATRLHPQENAPMSSLLHLPDQVEAITVQVEALPLVTADGLIAIGAADEERLRALEDAAARLAAAARAKLDALASY